MMQGVSLFLIPSVPDTQLNVNYILNFLLTNLLFLFFIFIFLIMVGNGNHSWPDVMVFISLVMYCEYMQQSTDPLIMDVYKTKILSHDGGFYPPDIGMNLVKRGGGYILQLNFKYVSLYCL